MRGTNGEKKRNPQKKLCLQSRAGSKELFLSLSREVVWLFFIEELSFPIPYCKLLWKKPFGCRSSLLLGQVEVLFEEEKSKTSNPHNPMRVWIQFSGSLDPSHALRPLIWVMLVFCHDAYVNFDTVLKLFFYNSPYNGGARHCVFHLSNGNKLFNLTLIRFLDFGTGLSLRWVVEKTTPLLFIFS